MEEVYHFLEEKLKDDLNYILVGVSGGVDSMVLLTVLSDFLKDTSVQIVACHVHHNLRKESDLEQTLVSDYCQKLGVLFETTKLSYEVPFTEMIGREKRYQFLEEMLKKYDSQTLFLAHHGDDLVETVLMKLTRGTTLRGAKGISLESQREFYTIYRPFLFLSKEEIYEYAKEHKIPYAEDASNQQLDYKRNRYRKEILPLLKKENGKVHRKFLEYSQELEGLLNYVEEDIVMSYQKVVEKQTLDWEKWLSLKEFLKVEVLRRYLDVIYKQDLGSITGKHVEILKQFLETNKVGSLLDFPKGKRFRKTSSKLLLEPCWKDYSYPLTESLMLPNGHRIEFLSSSSESGNDVTYLDSHEVSLPLTVRNARKGDKMTIKNMSGHKKVGDIFTDEKVALESRFLWPIVTDAKGRIVWLPGLKKTQFDRKKDGKYDIILKYT